MKIAAQIARRFFEIQSISVPFSWSCLQPLSPIIPAAPQKEQNLLGGEPRGTYLQFCLYFLPSHCFPTSITLFFVIKYKNFFIDSLNVLSINL